MLYSTEQLALLNSFSSDYVPADLLHVGKSAFYPV